MQTAPYELDPSYSESPAMGLIVLQSDETIESEFKQLMPDTVRLFHSRIPMAAEITAETLSEMQTAIPQAAGLFPANVDLSVIGYACTSATTVIGESEVRKLIQRTQPNAQVTNPLTAVKAKLKSIDAQRIGGTHTLYPLYLTGAV